MSSRVATFLTRAILLATGVILVGVFPRASSAAGCHHGERPLIGKFEALWVEATLVDPILDPAALSIEDATGHLDQRPCSEPAPRDLAPGHAARPACAEPIDPPLSPPVPVQGFISASPAPYDSIVLSILSPPPKPTIDV